MLALAAYRIVQEGLTNALRYAPGARVAILVRGDPATLFIEITNGPAACDDAVFAGAGTGTGNGLRGLHELADACEGTLEAGPAADRGWRVAARLSRRSLSDELNLRQPANSARD